VSAEEEKGIIIQYRYISAVCYRILSEYLCSGSNGQHNRPSNIEWVILSDRPDTHWVFVGCIHWFAWQSIQYWLDDTIGSAGYPLDINWAYTLVRLTVHPILSGWYHRISRIPTEYSLGVSIGPPDSPSDSPSNIEWVIPSDQPDTHWIFIRCIYWSSRQSIQYCVVIHLDRPDTHWIFIWCIHWSAWQSIQY